MSKTATMEPQRDSIGAALVGVDPAAPTRAPTENPLVLVFFLNGSSRFLAAGRNPNPDLIDHDLDELESVWLQRAARRRARGKPRREDVMELKELIEQQPFRMHRRFEYQKGDWGKFWTEARVEGVVETLEKRAAEDAPSKTVQFEDEKLGIILETLATSDFKKLLSAFKVLSGNRGGTSGLDLTPAPSSVQQSDREMEAENRAKRRAEQLRQKGKLADVADVVKSIRQRDLKLPPAPPKGIVELEHAIQQARENPPATLEDKQRFVEAVNSVLATAGFCFRLSPRNEYARRLKLHPGRKTPIIQFLTVEGNGRSFGTAFELVPSGPHFQRSA